MHAIRLPFAAGSGTLITLAVFSLLWHFVSKPIDIGKPLPTHRIEFTKQIVDTPVETKRKEKIEREPPPLVPNAPTLVRVDTTQPPTAIARPDTSKPVLPRNSGFSVGSDREPIPIVRFAPEYPLGAINKGAEGWVKVQFTITSVGTVKDAVVVEADPPKVFDQAALAAIARWRYNPKIEGGVAVERVGLQTLIKFYLE
jgi:periplasmic protein TonB